MTPNRIILKMIPYLCSSAVCYSLDDCLTHPYLFVVFPCEIAVDLHRYHPTHKVNSGWARTMQVNVSLSPTGRTPWSKGIYTVSLSVYSSNGKMLNTVTFYIFKDN